MALAHPNSLLGLKAGLLAHAFVHPGTLKLAKGSWGFAPGSRCKRFEPETFVSCIRNWNGFAARALLRVLGSGSFRIGERITG